MAKARGKECEGRLSRSLKNLCNQEGGIYWRIEDGGGVSRSPQYGDFYYHNANGVAYIFECKETERNRFPLRNLSSGQYDRLIEFALLKNCLSYLFILFKDSDRAYMIDIFALTRFLTDHPSAKSLAKMDCEKLGICPRYLKKEKRYEITPLLAL